MSSYNSDLCFRSAVEVAAAIRARDVSPVEVFEAVAKRIEAVNPSLNAYCTLTLDEAREQARAATDALVRGDNVGPLHGVPVAVKDDLPVRGVRWTNGSLLWADRIAEIDDVTVARLRQAGAVILGKTNLPEGGHKGTTDNQLFGTTANPWDPSRTAGGSSGGSGAAVAAGLAYLALGTDIGGSIRIPASCCGIVGHKPTFGLIPRLPAGNAFVPFWVTGPMTRTVGDAVLGLRVLAGADDRDPFALPGIWDGCAGDGVLQGLRIAWCARPTGAPVEVIVASAGRAAIETLTDCGAIIKDRETPINGAPREALLAVFRALCLAEVGVGNAEDFARLRPTLSPTFAAFLEAGIGGTLTDYLTAQAVVTHFLEQSGTNLLDECDLLATPTIAVPPFPSSLPLGPAMVASETINAHLDWAFTWPFNLTGQPAVSVPCGWTVEGLPLGLQIVGRRGDDALVLAAAAMVEARFSDGSQKRVPV